jgi:penicillin-binding protein 1C
MTFPKWLKKRPKNLRRKFFYGGLVAMGLASASYSILPYAFPLPEKITTGPGDSVMLLDRNGEPLDHWVRPDYYRHRATNLDIIPIDLIRATLAAEDKRFYQHRGIDFRATARAIRDSWDQERFVSGASTITQQTVKICSKKRSRTLPTKIRECLTARHVEMSFSKEEILTAYFNNLDYGNRSQGPLQAARYYFGKPLGQLSLAECALLAGLPQAPSRLNPRRNPDAAIKRRNWVLDRLVVVYSFPTDRIARAKAEPLQLNQRKASTSTPHLSSLLRQHRNGNDIQTTLSAPLQHDITEMVRQRLKSLADKHIQHAAVVVIHNSTGEVITHIGSPHFNQSNAGQIDATRIPRSPGSALKPFTYLLAFEKGAMTPATVIDDIPTSFADSRGEKKFVNYDRHYKGPVTIHHALGNSLNVPAIRTLNTIGGPTALIQLLKRFGITTLTEEANHYGLGLTLGSGEVTLTELTNAYATLARMGNHQPVTLFPKGNQYGSKGNQYGTLSNPSYWMLAQTMSDNTARTASFGPHSLLRLPFRCAVKTGTSTDFRDNWCLGFTKDFTVGVWAGNLDNTPMRGVSGVTGAGSIFHDVMMRLHQDRQPTWFKQPDKMTLCHIDPRTGKQFTKPNGHTISLTLPANNTPLPAQKEDYDERGRVKLDARYYTWLETEGDKAQFIIAQNTSQFSSTSKPLHILSPSREATYFLDPDLPGNGEQLRLKTDYLGEITWSSPTLTIITEGSNSTATLTPGNHIIILSDTTGRKTSRSINVKEL